MKISDCTWPQVEEYLKEKDLLLIPIGSTEQHGPTGIIGTDFVTAQAISEEVAGKYELAVAPPICYGMARHHLGFPGSASLAPSTFIMVIRDIVDSFARNGFRKFVFVNGHGGNIAPLTTAFSEIKDHDVDYQLKIFNWWHLPSVREYEEKHFGDENGFHATCGEISVTMRVREEAFKSIPSQNFEIERPAHSMPLSPGEFRRIFPDGRMMSNPGLSTKQHGDVLFDLAVTEIGEKALRILES